MKANKSEPGVLRLRGIAPAIAVTFLCSVHAGAQIINPILAARDAINEAKPQKAESATVKGRAPKGAAPANGSAAVDSSLASLFGSSVVASR